MRHRLIGFFFFLALLIPNGVFAQEFINSFDVIAELNAERVLTISEIITYDFDDLDRHGIFRTIPVKYTREGLNYNLNLEVAYVLMDEEEVPYEVSREGDSIKIKIGDPDVTIRGEHIYEIAYVTDRAVTFFDDHDELYWNVTGNGWVVDIKNASFELIPPQGVHPAALEAICFTGPFGSKASDCIREDGAQVYLTTTERLGPGEGFTVAVAFPRGVIQEPTTMDRVIMILLDNGYFALPLIVLLCMFFLWMKKGRDPKRGTIIPYYESPEGLSPGEVAVIDQNGAFSTRALMAMILDLARRGYVHVRAEKKKEFGSKTTFTFMKHREPDDSLREEEGLLLEGLFKEKEEISTKDVGEEYIKSIVKMKKIFWKRIQRMKIFSGRPSLIRVQYFVAASILTVLLIVFLALKPFGIAIALMSGVIVFIFGWIMPRRTVKGAELYAKIKGFEHFMSVAMKDRLEFHNSPSRSPKQFHELLPYAVALRVEREWARQFEGVHFDQPEWAEGNGWSSRSPALFVSSLDSFRTGITSVTKTSGGSGSSGFSGGGGGGGGSW